MYNTPTLKGEADSFGYNYVVVQVLLLSSIIMQVLLLMVLCIKILSLFLAKATL